MDNTVARNIKRLRESKGLTQANLAERCGVTPMCVSRWENNVWLPQPENQRILAEIFGVSVRDLYVSLDKVIPSELTEDVISEVKTLGAPECEFILHIIRELKEYKRQK